MSWLGKIFGWQDKPKDAYEISVSEQNERFGKMCDEVGRHDLAALSRDGKHQEVLMKTLIEAKRAKP